MKKASMKALAGTLAVALTIAAAPAPGAQAAKKVALANKKLTITVGKSKKLKLKNNKKRVTWKVTSGKSNVKLKSKKKTSVTIVAKKKGSAKVQAVVGKKKYTCKVTVQAKKTTPTKAPVVPTNAPTQAPTQAPTPTPTPTVEPTAEPTLEPTPDPGEADLDPDDAEALHKFIEQLKEAGNTVSENILDDDQYIWDDGYLSEIDWSSEAGAALSGDIVFPEFPYLEVVNVSGTAVTSLDLSKCRWLSDLICEDCANLRSLDLSGCFYMDEDGITGPEDLDELDIKWWTPDEATLKALEEFSDSLIENNNASEAVRALDEDGELNEDCYWYDEDGWNIYLDECSIEGEVTFPDIPNLAYVDVCDNAITSLDLSGCTTLRSLDCSGNALVSLNLSGCKSLEELYCYDQDTDEDTQASLNLTGCRALISLDCSGWEALKELDLSDCVELDVEDSGSFSYDDGLDWIAPGGGTTGDDFDI